jgi:hypothetical protein
MQPCRRVQRLTAPSHLFVVLTDFCLWRIGLQSFCPCAADALPCTVCVATLPGAPPAANRKTQPMLSLTLRACSCPAAAPIHSRKPGTLCAVPPHWLWIVQARAPLAAASSAPDNVDPSCTACVCVPWQRASRTPRGLSFAAKRDPQGRTRPPLFGKQENTYRGHVPPSPMPGCGGRMQYACRRHVGCAGAAGGAFLAAPAHTSRPFTPHTTILCVAGSTTWSTRARAYEIDGIHDLLHSF